MSGNYPPVPHISDRRRAILDARLSLKMPDGDPITAAFVEAGEQELVEAELVKWPRLVLPDSTMPTVDKSGKNNIGVHHAVQNAGKQCTEEDIP